MADYTYNRLAPYLEGAQESYIDLLTQLVGRAPGSAGVPTLDQLGPQIADQNVLTQQAQQLAATQAGLGQLTFGPQGQVTGAGQGTGVAGFQPFLDQAAAYSGPDAYKQFMSPYQQDVIDTTLQEYDIQAAKGAQGTAADAITAGAFGGGREGVRRAEYGAASDRNRAATQAKLLQEGFGTANQLASNAFSQQRNLASLQPSLTASNIQNLGGAGTSNLAYQQALLDAEQQRNQLAYKEPFDRLGIYGSGIASQMSGAPYTTTQISDGAGGIGPFSQALSAGLSAYGLGSIFGGGGRG
jgi:hypothetical protein|tara:strand:- start:124 stop:1017 length:894 start_codon:yes stop_codon:yes gene_type:complete